MCVCSCGDCVCVCVWLWVLQAAHIFRKMVEVVNHCHELGVMHRDLKPEWVPDTSTSACSSRLLGRCEAVSIAVLGVEAAACWKCSRCVPVSGLTWWAALCWGACRNFLLTSKAEGDLKLTDFGLGELRQPQHSADLVQPSKESCVQQP